VHRVPAKGEQLTMLSPAGDFRQAVATSLFWSDDHPPPSDDEDAVTITHPKFKLDLKDGTLKIETSENVDIKSTQTIKLDAGETITLKVGRDLGHRLPPDRSVRRVLPRRRTSPL
jgi:phage baseplate assembly protein gpV